MVSRWNWSDSDTDSDTEKEKKEEEEDYEEEEKEKEKDEERRDLPLLKTPENPLGYILPRVRMDENSDWSSLVVDVKNRKKGNYFAKRFIRQVKESRGYDVDCLVSIIFKSPYMPEPNFKKEKKYYAQVKTAAEHAVHKLNEFRPHKHYTLVDVQKVVSSISYRLLLLTFTVKEVVKEVVVDVIEKDFYTDHEANENAELDEEAAAAEEEEDDDNDDDEEEEEEDKDKEKGESENKDGEGKIITCQATVDICWFRKCNGYKLKELRIKPVTNAVPAA